jgi:hypothetical protein
MRNFEVTLTYKTMFINPVEKGNVSLSRHKVLDIELDESYCHSPEEFCDAVINLKERADVVRINIKEKFKGKENPLFWVKENFGRIYLFNGIPLVLNKN